MRPADQLPLTREEWSLILDANNGHLCMRNPDGTPMHSARFELLPNIEDHIRLNRADRYHGVHGDTLITKLAAFSDDDWDTVMAVVEGFWELSDDPSRSVIPSRAAPRPD
jgi:hypothetical protein